MTTSMLLLSQDESKSPDDEKTKQNKKTEASHRPGASFSSEVVQWEKVERPIAE